MPPDGAISPRAVRPCTTTAVLNRCSARPQPSSNYPPMQRISGGGEYAPPMPGAVRARGVDDVRPVLHSHSTTAQDPPAQPLTAASRPLVPTTGLAWLTPDDAVNESRPS
jgi:hypothetical protein